MQADEKQKIIIEMGPEHVDITIDGPARVEVTGGVLFASRDGDGVNAPLGTIENTVIVAPGQWIACTLKPKEKP